MGFIGGRVNHALYFAGYVDRSAGHQSFLGLDPHTCYTSLHESSDGIDFPPMNLINQIHVERLEEVDVSALDPSLALGLYFRTREEFDEFSRETMKHNEWKRSQGITPLYSIEHSPPMEYTECHHQYMNDEENELQDNEDDMCGNDNRNDNDEDEYVFI